MTWWTNERYNLIGQRFGRLTVIALLNQQGKKKWLCRCDCGRYTQAFSNNLKREKHLSCGCALKGINRKRPFEWIYNRLQTAGKKFGRVLTYADFLTFTEIEECHYCNAPIYWMPYSQNKGRGNGAYNIDRKDNQKGYTKDNCVVCCRRCNLAKGDRFTYAEWLQLGKVIRFFAPST